ncbi:hypothetical protein [Chitinophaga sp.]|uniref:hypothetical protein n=1 Tax=Chitinophaga sp. TaxID=1869181 RepID=UPI00262C1289|nr:hypothetical protein [uncultured Chitinophaga sp.]
MIKSLSGFAAACLLLAGCGVSKNATQTGLYTAANEVTVKTDDGWFSAKTISLGDYATTSRTNGIPSGAPAKQWKNTSDAFYFTVKNGSSQLPVQVLSTPRITFSARTFPGWFPVMGNDAPLWYIHAGATAADPLKSWEMIVKRNIAFLELNDNKAVGILRSNTDELKVTAHNRYGAVNSADRICYEFQLKGIPVAAVLTGKDQRAWLQKELDPATRETLAAVMLGLLFRPQ